MTEHRTDPAGEIPVTPGAEGDVEDTSSAEKADVNLLQSEESQPDQEDLHGEGSEPDSFPRSVVAKLRDENARYRQRAQKTDAYAERLHTELVRATGRLADPTDLPYSEDHLDDAEALTAAIDDLVARKPHLASRRAVGDIGQGAKPSAPSPVDLAALLRESVR
ncbi:hypothetical protein [Nocardia sp. IFM 10818]